MTVTLLVLACIAAANPRRAAAATPPVDRRACALVAVAATLGAIALAAAASGPILDAMDVTGPSARIGAGVALVVVCLKDVFAEPPAPLPALSGWWAGLIPVAFPVVFSPALALLVVAGTADRGVGVAVATTLPALALVALAMITASAPRARGVLTVVAVAGVALGAFVVLDGVYSI